MSVLGDKLRSKQAEFAERVASEAVASVERELRERAPRDTGELESSIRVRAEGARVIVTARYYAKFVRLFEGVKYAVRRR